MIEIVFESFSSAKDSPNEAQIRAWVEMALKGRLKTAELGVRIVDVAESADLNQTYRGKSGATNVLSFAFEMPELAKGLASNDADEIPVNLLGDIVICAPVVAQEALEQGKLELSHWAHMTVHGVLHLLGYDHLDSADAQEMESLEQQILAELGIADPYAEN